MTSRTDTLAPPAPPSLATLARTTAIALAVAAVLLIVAVLPAEYGIDPTGIGRRLGLTAMANPTVTVADEMKTAAGAALVPTQSGPVGQYPTAFKVDVFEITLQPYEYVEYKYRLEHGATMLYAWEASAGVIQDFHGERDRSATASAEGPLEVSYDKSTRRHAAGSFDAPFAGIHGWYWENPGATPITIRLTSSGYYSAAVEIQMDHSRHPHALRSLDALRSLE